MKQTLFERLLAYYDITKEEYDFLIRPVSLDDIPSPFLFKDMDKAVELVNYHIKNNNKIVVYGDYDVDGITACSIVIKALEYKGFKANFYIPSRYLDGYGITTKKAQEIIEKGYNLVITVDNGISAFEPIDMLRNAGIDVLVLDHHERQETLSNANVIIHPIISSYSSIPSSGAFTSYMFAKALLGYDDKYLSVLAAISLISDMMPLKGYNRDFLRSVINTYKKGEFIPIDLLLENEDFNDTSIGMLISPKLNAVGRVDKTIKINRLIRYLTSDNQDEVISYKTWLNDINNLRKEKTKIAKENIINSLKEYKGSSLVVLCDVEEGLLGLVANQLVNLLKIPVVAFTREDCDPHILKGSARSIEGFNIAAAFSELKELTITSGGHALAGGVSLHEDNFEAFKEKFDSLVKSTPLVKPETKYVDLNINEISQESFDLVKTFSPFGESWKAPLLKISHVKVSELMYSKNKEHIMTYIGNNTRILAFNQPKEEISDFAFVDMIGSLRISEFNGNKYIDFVANEIFPS